VECAVREIAEETGYTDVRFVRQTPVPVNSYYYSNVKDRHDRARMFGLLFELVSDDHAELKQDEGEKNKYQVRWVDDDAVGSTVNDAGHELIYRMLLHDEPFVGTGVLINSGQFDGLDSVKAQGAITAWLADRGVGRATTQYRL